MQAGVKNKKKRALRPLFFEGGINLILFLCVPVLFLLQHGAVLTVWPFLLLLLDGLIFCRVLFLQWLLHRVPLLLLLFALPAVTAGLAENHGLLQFQIAGFAVYSNALRTFFSIIMHLLLLSIASFLFTARGGLPVLGRSLDLLTAVFPGKLRLRRAMHKAALTIIVFPAVVRLAKKKSWDRLSVLSERLAVLSNKNLSEHRLLERRWSIRTRISSLGVLGGWVLFFIFK